MTPSSGDDDLERRLTVMLSQRAAAVYVESDADAVIAHAATAGERRFSRSWMLVAAATIVMLSLGLVGLVALRDPDRVANDEVSPTAPPVTMVPSTTHATRTAIAPTTTSTGTEPATGAPADGLVIVAGNQQWGGQNGDLYLLVPGEAPRMIVGAPGDDVAQQCPHLSTNGRFIAWAEGTATGTPSSYRGVWPVVDRAVVVAPIASDGTVSEPIVRVPVPNGSGEMTCPQWAPDGSAVAYRVDGDVWITDSVDGTTTVVEAEPLFATDGSDEDLSNGWSVAEVAWSNDGSRIAANEQGQVRIIDVATGASHVKDAGQTMPRNLVWLATDQTFNFLTNRPGDIEDIVVASVDGTGGGDTVFRSLPPPGDDGWGDLGSAALSPDGNRLAVINSTYNCGTERCPATEILIIDLATFTVERFPQTDKRLVSTVQWSPDGRRWLLSSIDGVFAVPVDGEGPTVTFATGTDIELEWSHDEITWQVPS